MPLKTLLRFGVHPRRRIARIKIYGERNTGTRFLWTLCQSNFHAKVLPQDFFRERAHVAKFCAGFESELAVYGRHRNLIRAIVVNRLFDLEHERRMREMLGWKHMRPPIALLKAEPALAAATLFLVTVKHPVFWALSFQRHPYHDFLRPRRMEFSDFLRRIFIPMWRDNLDAAYCPSIIDMYASKIDGYRELAQLGVAFELVRYEDLVRDVPGTVRAIAERHGLGLRTGVPVVPARDTKHGNRSLSDFQNCYSLDKVDSLVSPEDREFIIARFGEDRLRWLGYDIRTGDAVQSTVAPGNDTDGLGSPSPLRPADGAGKSFFQKR